MTKKKKKKKTKREALLFISYCVMGLYIYIVFINIVVFVLFLFVYRNEILSLSRILENKRIQSEWKRLTYYERELQKIGESYKLTNYVQPRMIALTTSATPPNLQARTIASRGSS